MFKKSLNTKKYRVIMSKATVSLTDIKEAPEEWANNTRIVILEALLKKASHLYYNTDKTILTDNEYDILIEVLENRKPNSKLLKNRHSARNLICCINFKKNN